MSGEYAGRSYFFTVWCLRVAATTAGQCAKALVEGVVLIELCRHVCAWEQKAPGECARAGLHLAASRTFAPCLRSRVLFLIGLMVYINCKHLSSAASACACVCMW